VMDLCRGNLLFQPWMGEDALTDAEMHDMAHFMRLLRLRPECFRHSRTILGDPWKNEPYAQVCSDGRRAFVAVNNFSWSDLRFAFDDPAALGFEPGASLFCHYPDPAMLTGSEVWLRPFDVALYELVPAGEAPTDAREFAEAPEQPAFAEPSVEIPAGVVPAAVDIPDAPVPEGTPAASASDAAKQDPWRGFAVSVAAPSSRRGGTCVVCAVATGADGKAVPTRFMGSFFKAELTADGQAVPVTPILADQCYHSTWQGWRFAVPASPSAAILTVTCRLPAEVNIGFKSYFIPEN